MLNMLTEAVISREYKENISNLKTEARWEQSQIGRPTFEKLLRQKFCCLRVATI